MTALSDCIDQKAAMYHEMAALDHELAVSRTLGHIMRAMLDGYFTEHQDQWRNLGGCHCDRCGSYRQLGGVSGSQAALSIS